MLRVFGRTQYFLNNQLYGFEGIRGMWAYSTEEYATDFAINDAYCESCHCSLFKTSACVVFCCNSLKGKYVCSWYLIYQENKVKFNNTSLIFE